MAYTRHFLSVDNFTLAFQRVVRGQNREYKTFFRHLYPSFQLGLTENARDLIESIRRGRYEPSEAICVYSPKPSGVLRPLRLLTLSDQVVYQAIGNVVANAFRKQQQKLAFDRSFGAIVGGATAPFFYRSWKVSYRAFDRQMVAAFNKGNQVVADFDLVSFFELIDHRLLRGILAKRVKDDEMLNLLMRCLAKWTENGSSAALGHGIPQGPETSAFLAECVLFGFDTLRFKGVAYVRYVDDIKLLAKDDVSVRRALVTLDLESKRLGLVPQAQKIGYRTVTNVSELRKTVPSKLASLKRSRPVSAASQTRLERVLRASLSGRGQAVTVEDPTRFKFALGRVGRRRRILRRVGPLLARRPDLTWLIADYCKKFEGDREAADLLVTAIRQDPIYDASAAACIDALDVCEPSTGTAPYRRAIQTAERRSAERSLRLQVAAMSFRGRRAGPVGALRLIEKIQEPLAKSLVVYRLFAVTDAPHKASVADHLLQKATEAQHEDWARYAAAGLLRNWPWTAPAWKPQRSANHSVKVLLTALGLRARRPARRGVLDTYFKDQVKIGVPFPWRKAMGKDWREAERRCIRVQGLVSGDPTSYITIVDTFNELLLQRFSAKHPTTATAFTKAAGKNAQPDLGNWLNNPALATVLPVGVKWYLAVHSARVEGDLAHAKTKKGIPTKALSFKKRNRLMSGAQRAWAELIREWKKVI